MLNNIYTPIFLMFYIKFLTNFANDMIISTWRW